MQRCKAAIQCFERFCDVMFAVNVASDADIDGGHIVFSFLTNLLRCKSLGRSALYPFDVGRVKENLPTTHIELGSKSERGTFKLESTTGKNSAYEGSGQK
ncbi:hypothetical protein VCR3J2_80096 [Vibrio coralliirubri]|nr:hypothetical protein VCR3J2_80096 [Vibrio coralliirubri]